MRATLQPDQLRLKLPWSTEGTLTITGNTSAPTYTPAYLSIMGNGIAPMASAWVSDISSSSPAWTNTISSNDTILSGLLEYTQLYKYARVFASSLHLEVYAANNTVSTSGNFIQPIIVGMIALPLVVSSDGGGYPIERENTPLVLNALSQAQLINMPRYKYRYQGGAGNSTVLGHYKSYGKTKWMLGYKKLQDNQEINCTMDKSSGLSAPADWSNPSAGWYYYIRFDCPQITGISATVELRYIIKMKFYIELFGYRFMYPQVMT